MYTFPFDISIKTNKASYVTIELSLFSTINEKLRKQNALNTWNLIYLWKRTQISSSRKLMNSRRINEWMWNFELDVFKFT